MEELYDASTSETVINNKRPREDEMEGTQSFNKKVKVKQNSGSYPCSKCELVATTPTNLSKHMSMHGSNQKYTCPLCDYSSQREGHVNNHLRKFHTRAEDILGDDFGNILEVLGSDSDGDEASFMQLCDEANFLKKNPRESADQDDIKPISITDGIHDEGDENHNLQQLSLDTLKKMEKSFQIKIAKLQLEIEGKLRFLETRKALSHRERSCGLMSRKVELILIASNLDKGSVEFAEIKREEEQVEAELRAAIIKQSSFSSILEQLDRLPGEKVRLLQPDEFEEFKNCVGALFLKFREANERLDLIVKRKRALEEDKWMERFAKLD